MQGSLLGPVSNGHRERLDFEHSWLPNFYIGRTQGSNVGGSQGYREYILEASLQKQSHHQTDKK